MKTPTTMQLILEPNGTILLPVAKLMPRASNFKCRCLFLHIADAEAVPCMILQVSSSRGRDDLPCLMKSHPMSVLCEILETDTSETVSLTRAIEMYFGCARDQFLNTIHYEAPEVRQELVAQADAFFATAIGAVAEDSVRRVDDDKSACDVAVRALQILQQDTRDLDAPQFAYIKSVIDGALDRAMERACMVRRRHACASRIQRSFLTAMYDPSHAMCRQRLLRDFEDMTHLLHAN